MNEKLRTFTQGISALKTPLIGITLPSPKYRVERPNSEVTVIEYIRSGTGYIMINGKPHAVVKGNVYLLCAGENQIYYSDSEDPFEKVFINATGQLAKILPHAMGLNGLNIFDGSGMEDIFNRIAHIVEKAPSPDDSRSIASLFFEALYMLSQKYHNLKHSTEAIKLREYIDANTDKLISNNELAALIYRSRDYCIKLFTAEYGTTPYEYSLRRKTEHACMLLDNTNLTVADIGAAVGYTDPQYFSGLFKKRIGLTPSAYRKRLTV